MLSAVAARKAAKAAAQAFSTPSSKPPSPPPPSGSSSPEPSLQPTRTLRPVDKSASKRKPHVSSTSGASKSKKIKVVHVPTKPGRNARYFDPSDTPGSRNGAISTVDDSTLGIECSSESNSSSEEEMEIERDTPPPIGLSSISVTKTKRAWSPSRPIPNSSDDEPEQSGSFTPASTKRQLLPLSTFRPVLNQNVFSVSENECATSEKARILVLQPDETLALVGTYSFCVLQGSLSLLGVTLSPSNTKHIVFAPRSSPIPILSWATPDHPGSCAFPIPPAVRQQAEATAILIEYIDTGVEGLGQICKVFESVFKPPREYAVPGLDLPKLYVVNHCTKDIHPFVLPNSWESALASVDRKPDSGLSSPPIYLVKGPKKSGKSTLARTLVNRLLCRYRRVAFLECDLGQSEFTPGGLVALNLVENYAFGPPFTHPSLPYRAHYIGSTSPRASPSHYLHSIQSLFETYKLDLQFPVSVDDPPSDDERVSDAIPLVVNTMGWNKGLGVDLNVQIEDLVEASHTLDIDGVGEKGWPTPPPRHVSQSTALFPFMRTDVRRSVKVESIQTEMTNTQHTPTDHRHLNILSYFHAVFPASQTASPSEPVLKQITAIGWDTSLPLCAQYPYEVDYMQAFDHVYLTGPGYEDVVPSELTRVLNGAIVGLVSGGPTDKHFQALQSTSQKTSPLPYAPGEPPPDPALSMCCGLALIRGIRVDSHLPHMHILTPVPTGLLAQARTLVKGEMELPIWGMLDFREDDEGRVAGVEKSHVPYLQWGRGEGAGGEKRRVRRNLMRKGQM